MKNSGFSKILLIGLAGSVCLYDLLATYNETVCK